MDLPLWIPGLIFSHLWIVVYSSGTDFYEEVDLCQAQCDVYCRNDQMACEEDCGSPVRRPVWEDICKQKQTCVSACIDKRSIIVDTDHVPQIPTLHSPVIHNNQTILRWDRGSNSENQTVIYIIQHQLSADSEWLSLGRVENTNRYVYIENGLDYCENHRFRVAAINQYGTAGFSRPHNILPKPKLLFEQNHFTYNSKTQEFFIKIFCDIPMGWLNSGARCDWNVPSFTGHCPFMPAIQPIIRSIKHKRGQWFEVSVVEAGFGCNYTGEVGLTSTCGARSDWEKVNLKLSDCSVVAKYPCPHKEVPPGQVRLVEILQDTRGLYVKWKPPQDKGSRGIGAYAVQWGFCHAVIPGAGLKLYKLEHEKITVVRQPELTLNVTHPTQLYGVRIAALSPGQLTHTVNFNVISTHCAERNGSLPHGHHGMKGRVLLKKNGVKVMHYPDSLRVLISWHTLPYRDKKNSAVKQYALRWGPLADHQGAVIDQETSSLNDTVMEVENSALIPGNCSEINITFEEPGNVYGLQVRPLHSPVVNDSEVEWNTTEILQFAVPQPPDSHQSGAPYPASSTDSTPDSPYTRANLESTTPGEGNTSAINPGEGHISTQGMAEFTHNLNDDTGPHHLVVYVVIPCVAVLVVMTTSLLVVHRKQKQPRLERSLLRSSHGDVDRYNTIRFTHNSAQFMSPGDTSLAVVPDKWEIPHMYLESGPVLGTGAFGQVVKGRVSRRVLSHELYQLSVRPCDSDDTSDMITVAIKMLQEDIEDNYRQDFLKEIKLMKNIGCHGNIVSMLGCCTLGDPVCLVVEHVPYGDLLSYLRDVRISYTQRENVTNDYTNMAAVQLTSLDLLSFARQIAVGMEFLSQKGYVHRDLAARNVLVGEKKTLKIGDFGLTRYVYDDKVYVNRRGGKLPIKWMSIEAIFDMTFSTASDVWSFGVVMFEICTLGGTPYPTLDSTELLTELRRGWRMPIPEGCSQQLYELMLDCWREVPSERPSFTALRHVLETMMEQNSSVDYIHLPPLGAPQRDSDTSTDSEGSTESGSSGKGTVPELTHHPVDSNHSAHLATGETNSETVKTPEPRVLLASGTLEDSISGSEDFVNKDVDDEVFDSTTTAPICECSHHLSSSAFDFGNSCPQCGKQQGLFQDRMKRMASMVCHSDDRTDNVSAGHGEFLSRSDCIRGDRIESDISSSTCSSGEFLIQQDSSPKERSRSRDSEASVTSATYLLCSPRHVVIPRPPPTSCLQETRL